MIAETIPQLSALSSDEKILLAAELLEDAVQKEPEAPDPKLVKLLMERLDYYRAHPNEVSTSEEVLARLQARKKQK